MSQQDSQIGAGQTGAAYRSADNAGKKAILNHHIGNTAPTYAEQGILWINNTATPWVLAVYDGADWITLGTINATTNKFIPANDAGWSGSSGGSANALTLTPAFAIGAYAQGIYHEFLNGFTNTSGTVTISVSGGATRNIKKFIGGAIVPLAPGDLAVNTISRIVDDGTQYLLMNPALHTHGADVASAATINLDTASGDYVSITGTTGISGITLSEGRAATVKFGGVLTLTPGANFIIPGGVAINTAAGDIMNVRGDPSGIVRVVGYTRADGSSISGGAIAANSVLGNATTGTAAPTGIAIGPSQLLGRGPAGNLTPISLGTGLLMSGTSLQTAGTLRLKRTVFTSSGTFTPDPYNIFTDVALCGAGGSGGYSNNGSNLRQWTCGAGGSSGGFSRSLIPIATLGGSQTVTIGAGVQNGTGGNTSFGSLVTANGGPSGVSSAAAYTGPGGPGGIAAAGTGDDAQPGGNGSQGFTFAPNASNLYAYPVSGQGAPGPFAENCAPGYGIQLPANTNGLPGLNATGWGAGGGGAITGTASVIRYGGYGGNGVCICIEYCSQ